MSKHKSVRINNNMRSEFYKAVKDDVLGNIPIDEDFARKHALAIYQEAFEPYEELAKQAPTWAIQTRTSGIVGFSAQRTHLTPWGASRSYDGTALQIKFPKATHIFMQYQRITGPMPDVSHLPVIRGKILTAEWLKHIQCIEDWLTRSKKLQQDLEELIKPLTMTKQLYEAWPGAKKYADCFPQIEKKRAKTEVTATQMDISVKLAGVQTNPGVEEN